MFATTLSPVPDVHPTATVDPAAELDSDVRVGPQCVITGRVRLGPGTHLMGHNYVHGPLQMGTGNTVYPFACIGLAPQDRKFPPDHAGAGTVIGDRNVFRESVTVHRATGEMPTRIGDDNYFMVASHVGHDAVVHNRCMLANAALVAGHCDIADDVVLGGVSGVHQFCRVGRITIMSGSTGVTQDIAPFGMIGKLGSLGGLNIIGLRRAGLREHIAPLKQAYAILFGQRHANRVAIAKIRAQLGDDPLCHELADFVDAGTRGVTGYARARGVIDQDRVAGSAT
jgi:UDP-N-acetylglucosamine acyltransferase